MANVVEPEARVKRRGNTAPHAQNYHTGIALVTIVAVTTWAPSWLQQPGGGQDHLAATAVFRPAFCPAGRAALQVSVGSWRAHLCPRWSHRTVARQTTWNRRVAMMLPSAPHATHSCSTHGSSEVLHGKRMSMTKLPQLPDCLSPLLPQAPSYAGRRQSHPPTHAHYGSAQHSGCHADGTAPRCSPRPTSPPVPSCAPSTCVELTHDELSTPLPSPLTSGNR